MTPAEKIRQVVEDTLREFDSMTVQKETTTEPIFIDPNGSVGPIRYLIIQNYVTLLDTIIDGIETTNITNQPRDYVPEYGEGYYAALEDIIQILIKARTSLTTTL